MGMSNGGYKNFRIKHRATIKAGGKVLCAICKEPILNRDEFTADHIIPKSKGGKNAQTNLQPAHQICNTKKGNTVTPTNSGKDK